MAKVEISYELIQKAAQHPDVRDRLQDLANTVKANAERLAAAEGVEMTVTTKAGIRPAGRPFVNVEADNADQEFGSAVSGRYRIMGRAGEGV
jgi:hypothetical protein